MILLYSSSKSLTDLKDYLPVYLRHCSSKCKYRKWLGHQVTCIVVSDRASYWTFIILLTLILPFCPPSHVLCFLQNPTLLFFLSHAMPPPAASPPGGSESGRSTPSLSTYSDGKSPSSTTYVAAPRHFHIPGRPRLCSLGCGSAFSFSSHLCTGCHWRHSWQNCEVKMPH